MISLYTILKSLNKEEKRNLSLYLKRLSDKERKDIALYKIINKYPDDEINEDVIFEKIYPGKNDKNTFYRLKNRLLNDTYKSLVQLYFNKTDYLQTLNYLALSQIFYEKKKYQITYEFLLKAAKKAEKNDFYYLLKVIYNHLIKLVQETAIANPEQYIAKRKQTDETLAKVQELDDLLAVLTYKIKVSQNFSFSGKNQQDINRFIEDVLEQFSQNNALMQNNSIQVKIYQTVSKLLLQKKDYVALEQYLKKTYDTFTRNKIFNKNNYEIKLQMLVYLSNTLFKNNKINESLKVASELYEAMQDYKGEWFDKYLFYYYNTLIINYQTFDKQKAIDVLLEAKEQDAIQKLPSYLLFVYLNLAVFYFDTNDFKNALRNLLQLINDEYYHNFDKALRYKIEVFLLMIYYEKGDIDLFDSQLRRIKYEYHDLLNKEANEREKEFLNILAKLDSKNVLPLVSSFIDKYKKGNISEDIINYENWLLNKQKNLS